MKIGLTGSIACGKSTVSAYLRELGFSVIDADAISRNITAPGGKALPMLREAFGDHIFDGELLNRSRLGSLVFSDSSALTRLNSVLHPMILKEIAAQLHALNQVHAIVFGDIPLLYECGMENMFDCVWVLHAPRETQIERLFLRDGLSRDEAEKRIDAQMPLDEKCRRADAVIYTDGSVENTRRQVLSLLDLAAQRRTT